MGVFDYFNKKKENKTNDKEKNISEKKSNKRKTLVKDFEEIVERGNEEEIKAVFKKCDINAYGGFYKTNALGFLLPNEVMKWLVNQGADINYKGRFQMTPLHLHAHEINGQIDCLIRLGANIEAKDYMGETPLFAAAGSFRLDNVKALVEAGANVNARNTMWETALLKALKRATNANIPMLVQIVSYLLAHGAKLTGKEQQEVERIGKDFEWFRENMEPDTIKEIEPELMKLYEIFHVNPVPKRVQYDGVSNITVKANRWQDQFDELWQLLVTSKGAASTIQGEVVRICGRLSYEILDNGKINWDNDFIKMTSVLKEYINQGNLLSSDEQNEINVITKNIIRNKPSAIEDELSRLTELCVKWVLLNPDPIPLEKVEYNR